MDTTWTWSDIAPERAGGRALPNHVRLMLITAALAIGLFIGESILAIAA
jgi:hypothetical protein